MASSADIKERDSGISNLIKVSDREEEGASISIKKGNKIGIKDDLRSMKGLPNSIPAVPAFALYEEIIDYDS